MLRSKFAPFRCIKACCNLFHFKVSSTSTAETLSWQIAADDWSAAAHTRPAAGCSRLSRKQGSSGLCVSFIGHAEASAVPVMAHARMLVTM